MSRYNEAHARLFTGVVPPATSTRAPLRRSHVVELVRFVGVRARVLLDHAARLDLHPAVGEQMQCDVDWRDGGLSVAVTVTAVHRDGFVDIDGVKIDGKPQRVRLRRYPEERRSR